MTRYPTPPQKLISNKDSTSSSMYVFVLKIDSNALKNYAIDMQS